MPIDVEELVSKGKDVSTIRNRNAQDAVLSFLKKHKKEAFTQSELGTQLEMRPQQVRQICIALEKKNIAVRKQLEEAGPKGPVQRIYWAIKP
jgi:transcription initiation factor IIE alpha subunit